MTVTFRADARSRVARRSSRAISRRVSIPLSSGSGSGNQWSQQCPPPTLAPMTMKRRQGRPMARSLSGTRYTPWPATLSPGQVAVPDEGRRIGQRVVREAGQIKWKGRNVSLTQALWGEQVGLKPVGDGRWIVYFESLELGEFDERTGRIKAVKRLRFNPQTA